MNAADQTSLTVTRGPLSVDMLLHRATFEGERLPMRGMSVRVLALLAEKGRVSRDTFLERVWNRDPNSKTRTNIVDVQVSRVRKVLVESARFDDTVITCERGEYILNLYDGRVPGSKA